MAIFVDSKVPAGNTYDPTGDGSATGGSDTSYQTMTAAQAGEGSGTTFNLRAGEVDVLAAQLILNGSGDSYIPWNDEVCWVTNNAAASDTIQIGNVPITLGKAGNKLEIRGAGSDNDCLFINGGSASGSEIHVKIVDYVGIPVRNTGPSGNFTGSIETVRCAKHISFSGSGAASTWSEVILRDAENATGSGQTGLTAGSSGKHTIQSLKVIRGGTATNGQGLVNTSSTGELVIEDGYSVGVGVNVETAARPVFQRLAGTLTINGGSWNGNVYNPLNTVYGGTVTINGGAFNTFIEADDAPVAPRAVSFIAWDSNHGDSAVNDGDPNVISLPIWVDQFGSKPIAWLPDDGDQFNQDKTDSGNYLLANGGELGAEGESSTSFDLATDSSNQPFTIYRSGGSGDVTIEIDTDTLNTLVVKVDGNEEASFDLLNNQRFIGHNTTSGGAYVFQALNGVTFGTATLTCTASKLSNDAVYPNQWDDCPSLSYANANYTIPTTSGAAIPLTIDRAKWFNFDIVVNRSNLQALFPQAGALKSFLNYKLFTIPTDAENAIKADNWSMCFAGISDKTASASSALTSIVDQDNLYRVGAFREMAKIRGDSIQANIGLTAVYTDGNDANNAINLTAWANAVCSAAVANGGYPVMELPRKNQTVASGLDDGYFLNTNDVTTIVNVFEANGFQVLGSADAANLIRGIVTSPAKIFSGAVRDDTSVAPQGKEFYNNGIDPNTPVGSIVPIGGLSGSIIGVCSNESQAIGSPVLTPDQVADHTAVLIGGGGTGGLNGATPNTPLAVKGASDNITGKTLRYETATTDVAPDAAFPNTYLNKTDPAKTVKTGEHTFSVEP